ncbi:GTPase-activator protein for ras-like GTPase containing protein [Phlyctema vagabunda]|uniref:GTPase-activator protein for ras-like GTPase containing protein n=1 Tax=Phlyctema vagabunda TaxID=108571 RepID=A0ABR4PLH8_9HELO
MDTGITDFEWLADLQKSQCFTTCELSNSAKSIDFGADGFTASVTDWHELLQITTPDKICGIVFVRGNFPNTADAILSRAQRRDDTGNKGTFGTQLVPAISDSDLQLGVRRAHGLVNLRWPYSQYELKRKDGIWDGKSGTYEEISFVRDRTVFHVVRVKWGSGSSLSEYDSADAAEKKSIKIRTGGTIKFGCPCSNGSPLETDSFSLNAANGNGNILSCASELYEKRLDMRLFVNGQPVQAAGLVSGLDNEEIRGTEVNISRTQDVELFLGEPTFILSTYALRDLDEDEDDFLTNFASLEDELGISNTSVNMTDRLWTALCSRNYEASEAVESCVVGRCVEQILGVSAVPFSKPAVSADHTNHSISEDTRSELAHKEDCIHETALLCNIIGPQYVDVQSAFFQIRLLAKAYSFITTRRLEPDLLQPSRKLDEIRAAYLYKLLRHIQSALAWLVNSNLSPGRLLLALHSDHDQRFQDLAHSERLKQCEKNRVKMNIDRSYNQACYATLAVWYVMKYCGQAMTDEFKTLILLPKLDKAYESVQKRASRDRDPTPKNDLLQWHHLNCLLLICNEQFIPEHGGQAADGFTAAHLDRDELLKTQQKFEKYVARLKTSQSDSYTVENEEVDRLLLLGEELGLTALDTEFSSSLAKARALHTRKTITRRKRTTQFNPGPRSWKGSRTVSNGPWELQCLNHQMYLFVADEANVKASRDRLFEFLLSDYSFMTSWDRSDHEMVTKWWDLEPVAVICVTLLDLKQNSKLKAAKSQTSDGLSQSFHGALSADQDLDVSGSVQDQEGESSIREILLELKRAQEETSYEHLSQIRQLLVQDEMGINRIAKPFDWGSCKPNHIYHPTWWVQSLNDSPESFKAKQTKDVVLRKNARQYFKKREAEHIIKNPEYTLANIKQKVPAEDLQFLSVFNLSLHDDYDYRSKIISIKTLTSTDHPTGGRRSTVTRRSSAKKQASIAYSLNQLEEYRTLLFENLNDSLVDLGAKYRILFTEKCSPSLVGSFIYLWHPDALDTFDSYFSASSRFSDTREANIWLTTITISHWSIKPISLSPDHIERFKENRNNGDFPPVSIARLGFQDAPRRNTRDLDPTDVVEERCSSLVITGDPSGTLWVCSIWSSLTDSETLSIPIQSVLPTMQCFLHQQVCARCLAFLVLLGHICENLAGEYDVILSRLDIIVGLGEKVLLEGLEWGTSEAVNKLKKMLWGLEALRVFDDRLSASISQIQKAQESMERTYKQEAGQQHVDLVQKHNDVLEEFEKRYGMLTDVQIRTQLKIQQVTGLRDGISVVTNVEDSKTALKQGNEISILTYITIVYLPLGFVTGLFSINENYASFMDNANNIIYAVLIVIFVLGTYALALNFGIILSQWAKFKHARRLWKEKRGQKADDKTEVELQSQTSSDFFGNCFRIRKGYEDEEKFSGVV